MNNNNKTNVLTIGEILERLPDAGVKKRKQLMKKLLRRIGAKHIWLRLAQSTVEESTEYLNDGSCMEVLVGWGYFSVSGFDGEEAVRDAIVSDDVCDKYIADVIKKALTYTKW